jgi:cell division septum initiation protein DivIVA
VFGHEKKDIDKLIEIIRCYIYGLEKKKKKDLELKIKELEEKIGINNAR